MVERVIDEVRLKELLLGVASYGENRGLIVCSRQRGRCVRCGELDLTADDCVQEGQYGITRTSKRSPKIEQRSETKGYWDNKSTRVSALEAEVEKSELRIKRTRRTWTPSLVSCIATLKLSRHEDVGRLKWCWKLNWSNTSINRRYWAITHVSAWAWAVSRFSDRSWREWCESTGWNKSPRLRFRDSKGSEVDWTRAVQMHGAFTGNLNDREAQIVSLDRQLNACGVSSASRIDNIKAQSKARSEGAASTELTKNEWERSQSQEKLQNEGKKLCKGQS